VTGQISVNDRFLRGHYPVRTCAILLLATLTIASFSGLTTQTITAQTSNTQIEGKSAIVVDVGTGAILYEENAHERLAPASLTKIFTAYFAIEASPLQRRMNVVKNDLVGEASAGLNAGDNLSLETLLHGMLLVSGNDAAMAIARNLGESQHPSGLNGVDSFTSHANDRLAELGLSDTRLVNPHGLDAPDHSSTAHDIAAITLLALQEEPDFLRILASPGYRGEGTSFDQQSRLIGNYPGAMGSKTGMTDNAGYCQLSIAHRDGRTIMSVVLGSTGESWYSDSVALLDIGFNTPVATSQPVLKLAAATGQTLPDLAAASIQTLAVQTTATDVFSIRPAVDAQATSWHILRWPIGAFLGSLVALVTFVQMRALVELQKRPKAAGRRPRTSRATWNQPMPPSVRHRVATHRRQFTEPFAAVHGWDIPVRSWSAGIGD
jgi:serine-type D-Ala-D-Ala carboxypeptidase (penicillin-binding protein 5/6)